jgi:hypothetical protein
MIRGALILAVGFSLGYAKALQEQDEVREAAVEFKKFMADYWEKAKAEEAEAEAAEVIEAEDEPTKPEESETP